VSSFRKIEYFFNLLKISKFKDFNLKKDTSYQYKVKTGKN